MQFVENLNQIIDNIKTVEHYLNSEDTHHREFARDMIRKGRALLIYKVNGEDHFAPAKFLGYRSNTMQGHKDNEANDGRDINPTIKSVIGNSFCTDKIDKEFVDYVARLGGAAPKGKRKYWRIKSDMNKYFELETTPAAEAEKTAE